MWRSRGMSVLPHENGATVSPRGLSVLKESVHIWTRHRRAWVWLCVDVLFCHRSINPQSVMTCSSVAAVPEDLSVPLLMLKVSPNNTSQFTTKQTSHDSFNIVFIIFFLFLKTSSRALRLRGTILPHAQLPSTSQTSRPPPFFPRGFFKSERTQHGPWVRRWPLLPLRRVACGGAWTAG